jgi:hypothetical protein
MGIRRARRGHGESVRVGQRAHAERRVPREHSPGHVPGDGHRQGRIRGRRARRAIPAQRLWSSRRRRQRLGMDERLVSPRLLRKARGGGRRTKPARAGHVVRPGRTGPREARPARRIVSLHRAVLHALSGRDAREGRNRDGDKSSGVSVREIPQKHFVRAGRDDGYGGYDGYVRYGRSVERADAGRLFLNEVDYRQKVPRPRRTRRTRRPDMSFSHRFFIFRYPPRSSATSPD